MLAPVTLLAEQTNDLANDLAIRLSVKPASCVALHKGQVCFQKIKIHWQAADEQEYCLYSDKPREKLICSANMGADYIHSYASSSSETYFLQSVSSGEVVATVSVNTAWVYRTGKRSSSGWRLF